MAGLTLDFFRRTALRTALTAGNFEPSVTTLSPIFSNKLLCSLTLPATAFAVPMTSSSCTQGKQSIKAHENHAVHAVQSCSPVMHGASRWRQQMGSQLGLQQRARKGTGGLCWTTSAD